MRKRVRNEPDSGPAAEGAMVTYSRLPRGERRPAESREPFDRQEPYIEAREVPYQDDDLRAYDPERAPGGLDGVVDDLEMARARRGRRGGGGRAAVLIGALALAAGMVILAYAYGIATRVDTPSPLSAGASTTGPEGAATTRGTLSADDAARSIPVKGEAPAAALAPAPEPAAAPADTKSATVSPTPSSNGTPMDGDGGKSSGGAQPALVAPVPATATPAAPGQATAPPAKAANVAPAATTDDLMTNIERLLARDGATAGASGQPGDGSAASAGPTSLAPAAQPAATDALPQLPDPNAVANTPAPPANVGPQVPSRLIPPADIPNVAPSDASTSDPSAGLGTLH